MTDAKTRLWLRAANPFVPARGMAEAQRSARVAVIGVVVSLVGGISGLIWMALTPTWLDQAMAEQYQRMNLSADELAMQQAVMDGLMPTMMWFGIAFAVALYGVLAWAQWKYMTRAIPIILLAFMAYSLLTTVMGLLSGMGPGLALVPLWMTASSWITAMISAVLYVASLRGAFALHKLKQEA